MMPYDATLLPVSKSFILQVAVANLHDKMGLTPPTRDPVKSKDDGQLGYRKEGGRKVPLNIAYYGYDFNNHPMGHLTCGMFEQHDRARVRVQCAPYGKWGRLLVVVVALVLLKLLYS